MSAQDKLEDLEQLRLLTLGHDRDSRLLGNMRAETMWEAIEQAQVELAECKAKLARVEAIAGDLELRGCPSPNADRLNNDFLGGWEHAEVYVACELRAALKGIRPLLLARHVR